MRPSVWNLHWISTVLSLFFFLSAAPSASLGMIQRAKSSTLRSTASTSWASTCLSTWAIWWRRMRTLTRNSSLASSRMESPLIQQVHFLHYKLPLVCSALYRNGRELVFLLWHLSFVWICRFIQISGGRGALVFFSVGIYLGRGVCCCFFCLLYWTVNSWIVNLG